MSVKWDVDNPLGLCEGETVLQNDLLRSYYSMGANRSLVLLNKHPDCTVCLRTLQAYSTDCNWQERVRSQYAIDSQNIQSELVEIKTAILREFADKLYTAIQNADIQDSSLSQLSNGLKALFDGFAMNFDQMPTKRVQTLDLNKLSFEDVLTQYKNVDKDAK